MSGLGMVLDIAKSALAAQTYGMDVTAHNIANINTPGYSRQSPVYAAKDPALYAGLLLGRGVDMTQVTRSSDQFIDNRLMQENSNMLSSEEMERYMAILEGLFNENSGTSVSAMLSGFWNLWHDISNNPSGAPERIALYEHSGLLAKQFNSLGAGLTELKTDLTSAVSAGIDKINQITGEIAHLNEQIVGTESKSSANDLRDQRNAAVSELAGYIDTKFFEQANGSLTVVSAKGCILVNGNSSYNLSMGGDNGDRVKWQGSGITTVDVTDSITAGKVGGWLDTRDDILAKYKLDFNSMAKEFIWTVNEQHSQGVGLKLFEPDSSLTGTYQTSTDLGELQFGSKIGFIADGFKIWIEDQTVPANPAIDCVAIDLSGLDSSSSLSDLATAINNQITAAGLTGVTANGSGTAISLTAGNQYAYGFSDDDSNILAALGVNTFFDGTGAESIDINDVMNDKDYIAAARITDGNYASGDNTNALTMTDRQYSALEIAQWSCDRINGNVEGSITATIEEYYHAMVGSIGSTSTSISRNMDFSEVMVSNLSELRDSISAVSIDEEMANLIKFQHSYAAASKLIGVADEMMNRLLEIK